MKPDTVLNGGCHCRNIVFELVWPAPATEIPARRCGCTFCRQHGGVWTSDRSARLDVTVERGGLVSKYAFGTRTAEFHVCSRCGVVPLVTSVIGDTRYAVVNVNALNDTGSLPVSTSPSDFDGEGTDARLERRRRNWIPSVRVTVRGA